MMRYFQEMPPNARAFDEAFMHYVSVVPYMHFITASALNAVTMTLDLAYDSSSSLSSAAQPIERLHVIDTNIETAYVWQQFLRQLASRPRGPPQRMQITFVDALPRVISPLCGGRMTRAMQVRHGVVGLRVFVYLCFSCTEKSLTWMDGQLMHLHAVCG